MVTNGDETSATNLTLYGYKISTHTETSTNRFNFFTTSDGGTHYYYWSGSIWAESINLLNDSVGGDNYIGYYYSQYNGVYAEATDIAIKGYSSNDIGVYGGTSTGYGVYGTASSLGGCGVRGVGGSSSYGGYFTSTSGTALYVEGNSGNGIETSSATNYGIKISGNSTKGHLKLMTGLTSDPTSASEGAIYYNSNTHHLYLYDGTSWKQLD